MGVDQVTRLCLLNLSNMAASDSIKDIGSEIIIGFLKTKM